MEKDKYTVELIFDPNDTSACTGVRSFLEGFGHLTPTRIEAAIAKGKIRLKQNVGYSDARTILKRVRIEGAKCKLKKQIHALSGHTCAVKKGMEHVAAKVTANDIVCPKCNTEQSDADECRQCGIIFSKIKYDTTPMDRPEPVDNAKREDRKHTPGVMADGPPAKRFLSARKLIGRMAGWRRDINRWRKQHLSALVDCGILFLTALMLEIVLISLARYLWFILISTGVGEHFIQTHPEEVNPIQALFGEGTIALSINVVLWVLIVNLILSFLARIIYLDRFYLDSDNVVVKTIWILASALLSAWVTCQKDMCPSLILALVTTIPPTLCLLKSCLKLAKTILPEMQSVIAGIVQIPSNLGNFITEIKKR